MKFQLALLLLGAISAFPSPSSAQAPGLVNYNMVTSEVVDLMRVRLTWTIPTGTISGYNITCSMDMCESILAVPTPDASGRVSATVQHSATLNTTIEVFIRGVNGVELADAGVGRIVPVAIFDDARPTIRTTVLTSSFMILEWTLPPTAMGDGISAATFSASFNGGSLTARTSPLVVDSALVNPFNGTVNVRIVPVISTPSVDGDQAAGTLSVSIPLPSNVEPILSTANSAFSEAANVTVTWPLPTTTMFLEGYLVTYNVTDLISGSLVTSMTDVAVDVARISISACPYCEVLVDVVALYNSNRRAPLLLTSRFTTKQAPPSAPREVAVVRTGVKDLLCTWETPSSPNGVIINYIVLVTPVGGTTRRDGVGSAATTYTITNLSPNLRHTVVIFGETSGGEGTQSSPVMETTGFGVTAPSSVSVNNLDVTFTLSASNGPVGRYFIVVTTAAPGNTSSRTSIPAYSSADADFYGTRTGSVSGTGSMTVTIGTGEVTRGGGVDYTDRSLDSNTDFYVFVRAYSSLDATRFSDSAAVSFRTGGGANIVAIVVPIVLVYILLMVVLIVLGVLAYIYVGKAYKLRKKYHKRKQERERREQQAAAMNLVAEEGKEGSTSPTPKAEGEADVQIEVAVDAEKVAYTKEGTDF